MRVSFGLSTASVRAAREKVERYSDGIDSKLDKLCRKLVELGVDVAVRTVPVDTGDLRSSIRLEAKDGHDYLVVARNGHAAFVEFGTGVVGEGTYRGDLPGSWNYDERRTPEAHDPNDPTIWYYRDPVDGEVHWTRGRKAAHYMLRASEAMRQQVLETARRVWR
ncbi:MAG: HK97 gp10 family phage protein [Olsenella sp.]|nr:HK97 gp10 family phage protein [Olsenella sp.]